MFINITIRDMRPNELNEVLTLVLKVFMEFEAPEYSKEGVREFMEFNSKENISSMIQKNELVVTVAITDKKIVGMIAIKSRSHISLLFVDKEYHRRGIAKALFCKVISGFNGKDIKEITVNSSPYAVHIYKRLGFVTADSEQCINGIRFTPMKYSAAGE